MNADSDSCHRRAVLWLSCAAFTSSASARLCDPMLPALAREFLVSPQQAAWVVSAFSVAYGLLQALFGPTGDRVGKYRLIAWTTLACMVGGVGAMLSESLSQLVVARLLTGATAAGIIPLSMAWIGDTIPYARRQATLARFLAGQIVGIIGGQFIGGVFTDTLGFRWGFGFMTICYAVIGAGVYWESQRNVTTRPMGRSASADLGVLGQVALVWSKPWARRILATVFLEGMTVFGPLAFIPTYVHQHFGLSLTAAGGLMAAFGVGGMGYILFARQFIAELGEKGLARLGGLILGLAWLLLALAPHWAVAMGGSLLTGLGYYMLHNTLQTNATQMAPEVRGTAVSLFASAFFLGQSLGVIGAGALLVNYGAAAAFLVAALSLPVLGLNFARSLCKRPAQKPPVTRTVA